MAKGNLFLGMGRGKVGDVVFYRMNGQQMARVRNRVPKNPRTNEQLYQRAIIATIMKAYSAGKEIFDHSFQGYTIGEGCMRRFNSVNTRILRAALFDDINKNISTTNQKGRFVAPRSLTATPVIGLQVSEGTLTNTLWEPRYTGNIVNWYTPDSQATTVNAYFESLGISAGDIFTFVYMVADRDYPIYENPWYANYEASQYQTKFGWVRFIVKDGISDDTPINGSEWSNIFQIETGGELPTYFGTGTAFSKNMRIPITIGSENSAGVMTCIRSRNDYDLRSTAYMLPWQSTDFGITSQFVLDVWSDEVAKIGESELILEGGNGGSGNRGGSTGDDGGSTGNTGGGTVEQPPRVITNSPQNMRPSRSTARHKGTNNEKD